MSYVRTDISPAIPSGYAPSDLQSAYNLVSAASANGASQTIAIVDAFDDPHAEADLAIYRSAFGLPACTSAGGCFMKVNENGLSFPIPGTDPSGNWEGEESLDLDMASAICPNCEIVLLEAFSASTDDLGTAENTAAGTCGASVISNSWSGGEDPSETTIDSLYFDHPGVPMTFASGDSGYPGGYPAASPFVTAVGGTSLVNAGSPSQVETVWNDSYGSSGSLCSSYESQPFWQASSPTLAANPGVCSNRVDNDVSAVADPNTGVAIYNSFKGCTPPNCWWVYGGTSAATPIIAGVYALAGNGASINDGSYSYSHTSFFNDVINGIVAGCVAPYTGTYVCNAGSGYDGPTGNGTPNGISGF